MDTTNETLMRKLERLEWQLRRHHLRRFRRRGPLAAPGRGQGRILSLLKIKNEISQRDLAAILDITPQSLGELLGKLEKAGYIERRPSEEDKRIMVIHLTEAGKAAAEDTCGDGDLGAAFDCLDETEREAFAGYLDRIIGRLGELTGGEEDMSGDEFDRLREYMAGFGPGRGGMGGGFGHGGMRGNPGSGRGGRGTCGDGPGSGGWGPGSFRRFRF